MAHVQGECGILLPNGDACRRGASYTCGNWHLVCTTHRLSGFAPTGDTMCPMCDAPMIRIAKIEAMDMPDRRTNEPARNIFARLLLDAFSPMRKHGDPALGETDIRPE